MIAMRFLFNLFSKSAPSTQGVPLKFSLPAYSAKKVEPFNKDAFLSKDASLLEALKGFQVVAKSINRVDLTFDKRKNLTESLYRSFSARALPEAELQSKGGGIPDPENKKILLAALLDAVQTLIVSAQFLYRSAYEAKNKNRQEEVYYSAVLLLDLFVLKQWLLSIQYRNLSDQDWPVINVVFFTANGEVDNKQSIVAKSIEGLFSSADSLLGIYWHLQLAQMLDLMSWPTHLHRFLGRYLAAIDTPLEIKNLSEKTGRYALLTDCYDFTGARSEKQYVRKANLPLAPVEFDYQKLANAIKKDHLGILQAKAEGREDLVPARLAKLTDIEQIAVSSLLAKAIFDATEVKVIGHEHRLADFRVYSGLGAVSSLLNNIFNYRGVERLADMLAKRSSVIAEDDVATNESAWFILFQDDKIIRMSTLESRFTTDMRVGALLAYGTGDDTLARPRLAMVSRIQRGAGKTVIDLRRLARYGEPVKFRVGDGQARPALLIFDEGVGGWAMIFQPNGFIANAKEIVLIRNGKEVPFMNKGMQQGTLDFMLISTSLQSEMLISGGTPAYPVNKPAS